MLINVPISKQNCKKLNCIRCSSYSAADLAKLAFKTIDALLRGVYHRRSRICCALYKSRGSLIDRRTHYSRIRAYRPRTARTRARVRAHVVSNRYRGYRQTSGEINTHRPAASTTTTVTSVRSYIYTQTYSPRISHIFRRVNVVTADLRRWY